MENYRYMLSRDGKSKGKIININYRKCSAESCLGHRILVQWPDGKRTYPCSRGCKAVGGQTLQIF